MADEGEYGREASGGRGDPLPHDRVVFPGGAVFAITLLAIEPRLPGRALIERVGESAPCRAGRRCRPASAALDPFRGDRHVLVHARADMETRPPGVMPGGRGCTLLQLLSVALMPFATRKYPQACAAHVPRRSAFHAFVLSTIAPFSLLPRHVVIRQQRLVESEDRASLRWMYGRGLASPVLSAAAAIALASVLPTWTTGLIFLLIFPASRIVRHACFRRVEAKEPLA